MNDISTGSNGVEDLALVETKPGAKISQVKAEPGVNNSLAEPVPGVEFNDSKPKTMNPRASWEQELNIETRENIIINTDQIQLEGTRELIETSTFMQNSIESETYFEDITADVTSSYDDIESMSDMPGIETVTMLPKKEDTEYKTETTIIPEDETETTIMPLNEMEGRAMIKNIEDEFLMLSKNDVETFTNMPNIDYQTSTIDIIASDALNLKEITISPIDDISTITPLPKDEMETAGVPMELNKVLPISEKMLEAMETTLNPMDKIETTFLSIDVSQTTIMPTEEMESSSVQIIEKKENNSQIYNQEPRISLLDENPAVNKISETFESKNLELNQGLAEETTTIAATAIISLEALETTSAASEVDSEDLPIIEEEVSENLTTSVYLESAVAAVDIDSTTLPSILNKSGKFHKFETI